MNSWFQRLQPMVPSCLALTGLLCWGEVCSQEPSTREGKQSQHKAERPPSPGNFQWPTSFTCSLPPNILRMPPNGTTSWWPIPGTWAFCKSPSYPNLNKNLLFFSFTDANAPLIINIREPVFDALLEAVSYLICNSVQKLLSASSPAPLSSRDAEWCGHLRWKECPG